MSEIKYVWTFTLIDQDGSDEVIEHYPCWQCWNSPGDIEIYIQESFREDAKFHLERDLTEDELIHANDQINKFITEDVKQGRANYAEIELYDRYNQSAEKVFELRIWSLAVL